MLRDYYKRKQKSYEDNSKKLDEKVNNKKTLEETQKVII